VKLLALLATLLWATVSMAQTPGTVYPSQKIVFADPLTGKTVWRMTTCAYNRMGDQTMESTAFSPDSSRIVYQSSGCAGGRPAGLYSMNVETGEATLLVVNAPWHANAIYSKDGTEAYYFARPSSTTLRVMAVKTAAPWTQRILLTVSAEWQEKIAINSDGTFLSATVRLSGADSSWRTLIFDLQAGALLSNWTTSGPSSEDGVAWSPTNPKLACVSRNGRAGERIWDVTATSAAWGASCTIAHAGWHPNGNWYSQPGYLKDAKTGANIIPGTGTYPIHPFFNPTEAALGTEATLLSDDRDWFSGNTGRPRLYRVKASQLATGNYRPASGLYGVHYSKMVDNGAHVHPQFSGNGQYILWQSDLQDLRDGTPPGGTGGQQALFIMPLSTVPPPAQFPVTTSVEGNGSGAVTGAGTYTVGAMVTLGATATADSVFVGWAPAPCAPSFVMPAAAVACVATFALQPADLQVSPLSLTFSMRQGDAAPAAKTVTVSNAGAGTLSWMAVTDAPWLTATIVNSGTLSVLVDPTGLPLGTYSGSIVITAAAGTLHSPQTVGVAFTISPQAPPAPTVGAMGGVLTWPASPGATSYRIERKVGDGPWEAAGTTTGTSQPISVPQVCWHVIASNAGGDSPPGAEVCR
jgi:hypothetical protein